jgi:hypothetical protein
MYAKGTDITKLPYTDTMGTNPLYAGFFDISPYRPGMAQPLPPASQGTPYAAYSPTSKSNASFSQSNSPQQALWRLTQPNTQQTPLLECRRVCINE